MSEYIKREDAEQSIVGYFTPKTYDGNDVDRAFKIAGAILNHIPPADVVEVKHGHWDFYGLIDDIYGHGASCSVCGGYSEDNGYYCSCCGAKMDDALQRKTNPEAFKGGDDYE